MISRKLVLFTRDSGFIDGITTMDVPDWDNLRTREDFDSNIKNFEALVESWELLGLFTDNGKIDDFKLIVQTAKEINAEWYSELDKLRFEEICEQDLMDNYLSMQESLEPYLEYDLK